jgi:hypothetical protein
MHEEQKAETLGAEQEFEEVRLYNNTVVLRFDPKIHAYYVDGESGTRFRVASVTEVLGIIHKPALVQWSATAATEYLRERVNPKYFWDGSGTYVIPTSEFEQLLQEARLYFRTISKTATDIGTIAHEWLEVHLKSLIAGGGGMPPLPENEKAQNCIKAALEWFDRHKFRPVSSECKVYSKEYIYSGTEDWDGFITGCGDPACCPFEGERFVLGDFKSSKNIYQEYRVQLAAYRHAREEEFPDLRYDAEVVMRLDKEGNGVETLTIMPEDFEDDFDAFLGAQAMYNWEKQIGLDNRMKKAALRPPRTKRKPPKKVVIKDAFVPVPVAA